MSRLSIRGTTRAKRLLPICSPKAPRIYRFPYSGGEMYAFEHMILLEHGFMYASEYPMTHVFS